MNPYGECGHTKYEGCPPCIHDAYQRGREDAAKAVEAIPTHEVKWKRRYLLVMVLVGDAIAAARGEGEQA